MISATVRHYSKYVCMALLLVFSICAVWSGAFAQTNVIEVDNASDFDYWMENAPDGSVIRLMSDLSITTSANVPNTLTLDMNGKTIRNDRTNGSQIIWVQSTGYLTITGNGVICSDDHSNNILYTDGRLDIINGTYKFAPYNWGPGEDCEAHPTAGHYDNPMQLGSLITSRGKPNYNGAVNIYGGTFDIGFRNPEAIISKNPTYVAYPLFNENNNFPDATTIFSGTFIGVTPLIGDGNPLSPPNIPSPWQLLGQTKINELPDGYEMTETSTGSTPVYKLNYLLSLPTAKVVIENKGERTLSPKGFKLLLTNCETNETYSAVSDASGSASFTLPTALHVGDSFKLSLVNDNRDYVTYSTLEYDVSIIPGNASNSYAPIVQLSLDGQVLDKNEAVFTNVYQYQAPEMPLGRVIVENTSGHTVSLENFKLLLTNCKTNKTYSAFTGADGYASFTLPTDLKVGDHFKLSLVNDKREYMKYSTLEYDITVVSGNQASSYAPIVQLSLDGQVLDTNVATFINTYEYLTPSLPQTGDNTRPFACLLSLALSCGLLVLLANKRRRVNS